MATKAKAKPQTSAPPTYTCAMDKLRDEMAKSKQRYVQVVGEYLTDYLQQHPEAEEKLMAAGKSIEGSLGAMKDEARKHEQSGVGILDDATAFGIVLRYFGIEGNPTTAAAVPLPSAEGRQGADAQGAAPVIPSEAPVIPSEAPVILSEAKDLASPSQRGGAPAGGGGVAPVDPFDLDALMGGI